MEGLPTNLLSKIKNSYLAMSIKPQDAAAWRGVHPSLSS